MTTKMPSTMTRRTVSLTHEDEGRVVVRISSTLHAESMVVNVKTSDLLAAVRSELGVLIIDKADLPEVTGHDGFGPAYVVVNHGNIHQSSFTFSAPDAPASSAEWHRQNAYAHLALAEYLEAHPPVDEQQVEALAGLLRTTADSADPDDFDEVSRRLIATGKVTVQP